MYDVVIIGGGPAGSTLARELPKTLKIAIIDKKIINDKNSTTSFKKCCGGLLAPDAQENLAKFGYGFPKEILVNPQIFAVETIDLKENITRFYQRSYLNFNRHYFDLWLMSLIPNNVDVIDNSRVTSLIKNKDSFLISYIENGAEKTIASKYIVGAEGANSIVRKTFFKTSIRQYIAIQKSYIAKDKTPYYICFFDNSITDCYGWINVKDDLIQLGVALPKKHSRENFDKIEDIFIKRGFPFENPIHTESCLVNRPKSLKELEIGRENIFLIGEAAGFISTSSLEGISFAMESAYRLAKSFTQSEDVYTNYRKNVRKLKLKVLKKLIKTPFIYNPFLRKLIMKSGVTSLKLYK
ncbi:FAD-binding protein [Miniphocaeibacter massiliensis]|uniref:FAD-binding protein n=1 Tax=Miniphocaeibacter massiliensis TaxID=2041841 RepID=UPI000C1C08CB|nr:FAD-binding protein [Miniphocaeibacter massiliensis]